MKTFTKLVLCYILAGTSQAQDTLRQDDDIIRMLDDTSSASTRLQGFLRAKTIDSRQINNKLVDLLDSKVPGGKEGCVVVMPSWYGSLRILAARFPEAGIEERASSYTDDDVAAFKAWWARNEMRIDYHDNTHKLAPTTNPSPSDNVSDD